VAVVQYTFTHKQYTERHKTNNTKNNTKSLEECGPCPVFADYTLAFTLQLRKKHGKSSVRVAEETKRGKISENTETFKTLQTEFLTTKIFFMV
jgi:hypothetical protein